MTCLILTAKESLFYRSRGAVVGTVATILRDDDTCTLGQLRRVHGLGLEVFNLATSCNNCGAAARADAAVTLLSNADSLTPTGSAILTATINRWRLL